jgi:hypothetical protein
MEFYIFQSSSEEFSLESGENDDNVKSWFSVLIFVQALQHEELPSRTIRKILYFPT